MNPPSVGDGYAASGKVVTYTLPPEEIARIFGRTEKLNGKPPIKLQNPYQREAKGQDMMLKDDFESKLPKEKYLELRENGYSDAKILKELKLPFNAVYHLTKAKKEWGIPGKAAVPKKPDPVEPKTEEGLLSALSKQDGRIVPFLLVEPEPGPANAYPPESEPVCGVPSITRREEITGLEAFRRYDVLEAELIRLDVYINRRDEVVREMEKIKEALEAVMVTV